MLHRIDNPHIHQAQNSSQTQEKNPDTMLGQMTKFSALLTTQSKSNTVFSTGINRFGQGRMNVPKFQFQNIKNDPYTEFKQDNADLVAYLLQRQKMTLTEMVGRNDGGIITYQNVTENNVLSPMEKAKVHAEVSLNQALERHMNGFIEQYMQDMEMIKEGGLELVLEDLENKEQAFASGNNKIFTNGLVSKSDRGVIQTYLTARREYLSKYQGGEQPENTSLATIKDFVDRARGLTGGLSVENMQKLGSLDELNDALTELTGVRSSDHDLTFGFMQNVLASNSYKTTAEEDMAELIDQWDGVDPTQAENFWDPENITKFLHNLDS